MQESCIIYEHLCKEAISRGIKVSIETVPSPFDTSGAGGILQLIDMIGASNLGICIDSGHCNAVGLDVSEQIRIAGSKMFETHFHDNFGPQSNWSLSDMHNPVGIGTINWQKVILAIEQIDYHGWVTFEQSDFETNIRNWHLFCEKAQKLR
jgi:sugar phosphate isomerase/epimerase